MGGVAAVTRNTAIRDRDRKAIAREKPPCGICEHEIDYTLKWPDPMCYVVDHIQPWSRGGADELANKQAAHKTCNEVKAAKVADLPRVYVTHREW